MADVFVSYDRRDRDLAEKVVAALTEQGLTVWWDDRLTPHETWDKTIEREVDSAKKVLVLWTKHSVESDWVRTEAGAAKESTPPKLIQARFSDCKVPLAFRLLQHVDLIGWTPKRRHSGWDRLISWLKDGLEQPAAPAPGAGGPIPPTDAVEPEASLPVEASTDLSAAAPEGDGGAPETPVVMPAAAMGLGDFSSLEGSTPESEAPASSGSEPAGSTQAPDTRNEAAAASSGHVAVSMPSAGQSTTGTPTGSGGGIDKRLLIGGGIALGAVAVIALVMMLVSGGGDGFSEEERTTMGGYIDGYAEQYAQGYQQVGDDELARLADDAAHDYEVRLDGGRSYRVLGACDTNCRDVDLYVTDPSGQEIGRDILTDDYPVVEIPNAQDGAYTIRIGMPDCGAGECLSAARVYEAD